VHSVVVIGNFVILVGYACRRAFYAAIGRRKRRESICLTGKTRSMYHELRKLVNAGLKVSLA
jgi:hypothetical protein